MEKPSQSFCRCWNRPGLCKMSPLNGLLPLNDTDFTAAWSVSTVSTSPSSCYWAVDADIPNIHMLLMEKWFFFGLLTVWVWVSASSCFTWLIIYPHGIQKLLDQARSEQKESTEWTLRMEAGSPLFLSPLQLRSRVSIGVTLVGVLHHHPNLGK